MRRYNRLRFARRGTACRSLGDTSPIPLAQTLGDLAAQPAALHLIGHKGNMRLRLTVDSLGRETAGIHARLDAGGAQRLIHKLCPAHAEGYRLLDP